MGRRVLVTGGSRGIGRAAALAAAKSGFEVVLTYQSRQDAADEVVREIEGLGGVAACAALDISQREETQARLEALIESGGAFYGVVCNAGVAADAPFPGMTGAHWDQVLRTNLDGF